MKVKKDNFPRPGASVAKQEEDIWPGKEKGLRKSHKLSTSYGLGIKGPGFGFGATPTVVVVSEGLGVRV